VAAARDLTPFVLQGRLEELERIALELERFCQAQALDGDVEYDLNLVLEELFTNSLRHGGCDGLADAAWMQIERADDGIYLIYADRGAPYDPIASAPRPDLSAPIEQRSAGGLGVHLVRQIMTDIEYKREGDWNRLSMRRPLGENS
jgi:serine/threonine-protein kinase RsbW